MLNNFALFSFVIGVQFVVCEEGTKFVDKTAVKFKTKIFVLLPRITVCLFVCLFVCSLPCRYVYRIYSKKENLLLCDKCRRNVSVFVIISNLSKDRSKASSKMIPPHSAI